jgi:hypothetical protein
MSDSIKVEEKPKLEDITMEDATSSTPAAASTVSAVEEFAPQKNADGELIIKDLPEALKGKSEEEVAEVKKAIVEQGELLGSISNFYMRVLLASRRCASYVIYYSQLTVSHLAAFSTVEFYFSDANFPYDKFLYTLSLRDTLGWVDLPVLLSFKRMKGPFTQVYGDQFIIGCLREREVKMQGVKDGASRVGSLCVISEDGKKIRRREKELVKDVTAWDRTVYVVSPGCALDELIHSTLISLKHYFPSPFRSFSLF